MVFGIAAFTRIFERRVCHPLLSVLLRALGFYPSDSAHALSSGMLSQLLLAFNVRYVDLDGGCPVTGALHGLPCADVPTNRFSYRLSLHPITYHVVPVVISPETVEAEIA